MQELIRKTTEPARVIKDTLEHYYEPGRRETIEDKSHLLESQFSLWYREMELLGAVEEWRGLDNGEALTEEEMIDRKWLLFGIFVYELKREGLHFSDEEIEKGFASYAGLE